MRSTWLVIAAGILAVIGLIVNAGVDRDNIYDMTTIGLFIITLILAFAGAYLVEREVRMMRINRPTMRQEAVSKP